MFLALIPALPIAQMPARKTRSKLPKGDGGSRDLSNVDIPTVLDVCLDDINGAPTWASVVEIMCCLFKIPGKSIPMQHYL